MSDYATTKQAIIDACTDDSIKTEIENNYSEAIHNELQALDNIDKNQNG